MAFVSMKSVLIIQTAFIGDVILSTVLVENIKRNFPDAKIDFLTKKGNESLLENHPYLSNVFTWNKKEGKYRHLFQLLKTIRRQRYDLIINVQRFAATGLLAGLSGAKQIIGYNKNPFKFLFTHRVAHRLGEDYPFVHEISRCNDLLETIVSNPVKKPRIYPSPADYQHVAPYSEQPFIVVAPGSVWFTKQVPVQKWIAIINRLPGTLPIYIIGSEKEESIARTIIDGLPTHTQIHSLTGKLTLLQSAALMQSAVFNIVNDSAPLHLASAVDAPVIALYCSTSPAFGFTPLSTESYSIEADEPLPCHPCGLHGKAACPENHFNCGKLLNEQKIAALVWQKLAKVPADSLSSQSISLPVQPEIAVEQPIY